ncbi:alpha/beta hydrolase [[Clostridium] aminophilum]|uniref:Alpha/beta hydrolase n=1 Tax=[Clostridium] aminophilum TaxID=1526 RepID=A0A1I6IT06_9FIRM|nr:alpha/beta hydrolase [[Clostridium] aminophilum]SFR69877.1 hypothetical protein SAMN02910262_00783 [[Clostridium] aminophilum]
MTELLKQFNRKNNCEASEELGQNRNKAVLYVHGKGGNAEEAEHYMELFPECDVYGLDYRTDLPWETNLEVESVVNDLSGRYRHIILIANSIGAFYSINANIGEKIERAFFISPMVNMEKLILSMMTWAKVSEADLQREKNIRTEFGEDLSWEYLCYVREHPVSWRVPTDILYGSEDHLQDQETVRNFAEKTEASLTVMKGGEHWFHTEEQVAFLDRWLEAKTGTVRD